MACLLAGLCMGGRGSLVAVGHQAGGGDVCDGAGAGEGEDEDEEVFDLEGWPQGDDFEECDDDEFGGCDDEGLVFGGELGDFGYEDGCGGCGFGEVELGESGCML
mmetsp:Transcript_103217/g.330923  ORF Transcript_103217/g.330923 Transcript_103217/m.330923 type:complete len:105 (+) Transcript_103217:325-639(+)